MRLAKLDELLQDHPRDIYGWYVFSSLACLILTLSLSLSLSLSLFLRAHAHIHACAAWMHAHTHTHTHEDGYILTGPMLRPGQIAT